MTENRKTTCYFVSDLHGKMSRYKSLFKEIRKEKPAVVLLGGDLLPLHLKAGVQAGTGIGDFLTDYILPHFQELARLLGPEYPQVFVILGNDDARDNEPVMQEAQGKGLWTYLHGRSVEWGGYTFYGYSFVPPTPFRIKDWEKYDVSRYVDPGCTPPTEGIRTVEPDYDTEYATIQKDLEAMTAGRDLSKSVFLFHSPPYQTMLDRAALDGIMVDHAPLDVHVGSIAIQRFIEERQPMLTLHGHIHESARIQGTWKDRKGATQMFTAAHDGPELALVKFTLEEPQLAERLLLT